MQEKQKRVSVFNTEEQKQAFLKVRAEREKRMQEDPEFRKKWEKRKKDAKKFMPD